MVGPTAENPEPNLAEFRTNHDGTKNLIDPAADDAERAGIRSLEFTDRDGRTWTALAAAHQFDVLRQPTTPGRYSPPLGVAPVGDLGLEDWFERLPQGLPGWPGSITTQDKSSRS